MWWVLFEVLLAFGLAVFIVWWTFPRDKKEKPANNPPSKPDGECSTRGTESVNSGIVASNLCPSSATT